MTVGQLIKLLQTFDNDAEVIIPDQSTYYGVVRDAHHDWASQHPRGLCLAYKDEKGAQLLVRLSV